MSVTTAGPSGQPSEPKLRAPSSWMLYEDLIYRQIFMDGRDLPKDP
jgi:hypothetical protein